MMIHLKLYFLDPSAVQTKTQIGTAVKSFMMYICQVLTKISLHQFSVSWQVLINIKTSYSFIFILIAWGGGDPQITTYDGLSYTFNGLGDYVLSKAIDGSFQIQTYTNVFRNVKNPNLSGTFFAGFAIQITGSPIVQVSIPKTYDPNPQLGKIKSF